MVTAKKFLLWIIVATSILGGMVVQAQGFGLESVGMKAKMPHSVYWGGTCVYQDKLYVFGGIGTTPAGDISDLSYTQIYDPATDTWSEGAPMPTPRRLPGVAVVNGIAYVTGGRNDITPLAVNEAYDFASDTWISMADLPLIIRGHSTVAVGSKIYLIGGNSDVYQNKVRIYNPATDTWSMGADMPYAVAYGNAVYMESTGRIIYAGGDKGTGGWAQYMGRSITYNPAANLWDEGQSWMIYPVNQFAMAADQASGKVYAISGQWYEQDWVGGEAPCLFSQVLDPVSNEWVEMPSLPNPGRQGACAGMIGGKLYVASGLADGDILPLTEEFDPASDSWYQPNPPSPDNLMYASVNAVGGIIYINDGLSGDYGFQGQVYTFDPSTMTWGQMSATNPIPREGAVSAVWNDKIIISGGDDGVVYLAGDTVLYDPATDSFSQLNPDLYDRAGAFGAVVGDKFFVFGGEDVQAGNYCLATTVLDMTTGIWTEVASMPVGILYATAQAVNGKIYIVGGYDGEDAPPDNMIHDNVLIYDPATDSFSEGSPMPYATYFGSSVVYNGMLVQDSGYHLYYDASQDTIFAEMSQYYQLYNPSTDTWATAPIRGWGRSYHGTAAVGNRIYSMFGWDWDYPVNRLDIAQASGCEVLCFGSANQTSGTAPLSVQFNAGLLPGSCLGTTTYYWEFGDGRTSTEQNPAHMFTQPKSYYWHLTVTVDDKQCVQSGVINVTPPRFWTFYDDFHRSQACIDTELGTYIFNVAAGPLQGTYSGPCYLSKMKDGYLIMTPENEAVQVRLSYNYLLGMASGKLYQPFHRGTAVLYDSFTENDFNQEGCFTP